MLGAQVVGQRVPCATACLAHDQRRRGDLSQRKRPAAPRPRMARRGDHQHLVVAQVRRHQVGRQVRGLDEAEPHLDVPYELDHRVGVGHGQLDHGRSAVRRLTGAGLLDAGLLERAQLD
jgi:hypothetical protein